MKVTLAFYKDSGNIYDKLIRLWTKSKYSHVEIIIGQTWYSSNIRLGGVTTQPLRPLNDSWDYVDVNVDGRRLTKVLRFIESQQGTKYDIIGAIIGAGLNIDIHEKNKWFCSELVAEIMLQFNEPTIMTKLDEDTFNLTPKNLYNIYKV